MRNVKRGSLTTRNIECAKGYFPYGAILKYIFVYMRGCEEDFNDDDDDDGDIVCTKSDICE